MSICLSALGVIMRTPESRKSSEDDEKIATKKPYPAPTLVELGGDLTEAGNGNTPDNIVAGTSGN